MLETEKQEAVLQNFRVEIKGLKEKVATLFAVEDVNDLRLEELEVWEKYKLLFKNTETALSELDMRKKDVLSKLTAEFKGLVGLIKEISSVTKNTNQLEFLAWMNNRLVVLSVSLQLLQYDKADEETLLESRDHLAKERRGLLF